MFDKDRLFAALNLSESELDLYNRIANELQKNIVYPDLVIFLQSDTDRLMYNIELRGREFEKDMDEDLEDKEDGRKKVSHLEDIFEAFIGAIFIDFNKVKSGMLSSLNSGIGFGIFLFSSS